MIDKLTPEQEAKMADYVRVGIEIGLATGPEMDEDLVLDLVNKHRELCNIPKVKPGQFEVADSPNAAIQKYPNLTPGNAFYGQHDINWLMYYQFMRVEVGVKNIDSIRYLLELAKHCNWMWMDNSSAIVCRRPAKIFTKTVRDGDTSIKILHNPDGKALEFVDGYGLYRINGVSFEESVAKDFIEKPASEIDPKAVLNIKNAEQRTEIIKKLGVDKMFNALDKKKLDHDTVPPGGTYDLFEITLGNHTRRYLKFVCPSDSETHCEAVPGDVNTVKEAIMWRDYGNSKLKFTAPLAMT